MSKRRKLLVIAAATICSLVFAVIPKAFPISPVLADVTWTKYGGDVTLDNQKYVLDCWVLKDGSTYRMWYTHLNTDFTIESLKSDLGAMNIDEILDDLASPDIDKFLDDLESLDSDDIKALLDGTTSVIGYATSTNGKDWTVQDDEVLAGDSDALWDAVLACSVIKDGSTYKMWYTNHQTDLSSTGLQSILNGLDGTSSQRRAALEDLSDSSELVIGYATSTDCINWTVVDNDVLSGSGDLLDSVLDPCVIKDGSTYKMWYTNLKSDVSAANLEDKLDDVASDAFNIDDLMDLIDGIGGVIGYATSTDGINWTVQDDEVLTGGGNDLWNTAANPSVIQENSSYEMWYTNGATDIDERSGLQDVLQEIYDLNISSFLDDVAAGDLDAFIDELTEMNTDALKAELDNTSTVIGYATSTDGINWTEQDADDVTGDSDGLWSSVFAPAVVEDNGSYEMWFTQGIDDLTTGNLLDILDGTNLSLGYAYTLVEADGAAGAPAPVDEDGATYAEMDPDAAADILEVMRPDNAADILEDMPADDAADILEDMNPDDAADILEEMPTVDAADVLEEMPIVDAADVLTEMGTDDAAGTMEEMGTGTLEGIIPNIDEGTLTDVLPGLSTDTLYTLDPQVLFDSLPNAPTEQLLTEAPPLPPAEAADPVTLYSTPSGARYLAIRTWAGEWVTIMATPYPLEQLLIKTNSALENIETEVEVMSNPPAGVTQRLPSEMTPFTYFTIALANITPQDIDIGHLTFKVDKEWLEDNSFHKWSVLTYQYDRDENNWTALATKRIDEDDSYIYYSSPIGYFSMTYAVSNAAFAIAASEDVPANIVEISNLAVNPVTADAGQDINISADVTNLAPGPKSNVVTLWIDGTLEAVEQIDLLGNETKSALFTVSSEVEGSHEVRIDRLFSSFQIAEIEVPPAAFTITNLSISPTEVDPGDTVTVAATVTNTGGSAGTHQVDLRVNAAVVETTQVTLEPGASATVTFLITRDEPGTYSITLDGLSGTFDILSPVEEPQPFRLEIWQIAVIAASVSVAISVPLYIRRRRLLS